MKFAYIYIYIYIYISNLHIRDISKVNLAIVVEGYPKAPFSIATTPRCRGGRYSFPSITSLYPRYVPYNAECLAKRHQVLLFECLVWHDLGLYPGLPGHWRTRYQLFHGQTTIYIYIINKIATGFCMFQSLSSSSHHSSISSIAPGRSSRRQPVSAQNWCR